MASLYKQVLLDLSDIEKPLSGALLRVKLLTYKLDSPEFKHWLELETNGYHGPDENTPKYRRVRKHFFGHYVGWGGETRNVPLNPALWLVQNNTQEVEDQAVRVSSLALRQPVASLEEWALKYKDEANINFAEDTAALILFRANSVEKIEGKELNQVTSAIGVAQLVAVLNHIRSNLMDLLLDLAEAFPAIETDEDKFAAIPASVAQEKFNLFFGGNFTHIAGDQKTMGDEYKNEGQAGAIGPGAHVHNNTFQQVVWKGAEERSADDIAEDLRCLIPHLQEKATKPEHQIAIGQTQAALQAAEEDDKEGAIQYLKQAGGWVFDAATKIGIGIAIAASKSQLGM